MKIAIVGSGVAGLAAAWLLAEHSEHEVHLYESDSRFGGHANTIKFRGEGEPADVDTGFIVLNPSTYPNFLKFLRSKQVPVHNTKMTFSVSRDGGAFEWAGNNLFTLFAQPRNIFRPKMWRMIYDILRFNASAHKLLLEGDEDLAIGDYLRKEGYSDTFRDDYLIPMTACIWSTPADKCAMDFPARTLIRFMSNHHLLQITGKPSWLTIKGGSRVYVERILSSLPTTCKHLSTPVASVSTSPPSSTVTLVTESGHVEDYDHVILACHSDTALNILNAGKGVTQEERDILGRFKWNRNAVVVHSDVSLMPKRRLAWSCWNFLTNSLVDEKGLKKANTDRVSLTYGMNDLQHLPISKHGPVLVTLNTPHAPAADKTYAEFKYDHPVLDSDAVTAQNLLPQIQHRRGISYAGAWTKYGFHEDGFVSGLRAAAPMLSQPFEILDPERKIENRWILSAFFGVMEASGIRVVLGAGLGWLISLTGKAILPLIDERDVKKTT